LHTYQHRSFVEVATSVISYV